LGLALTGCIGTPPVSDLPSAPEGSTSIPPIEMASQLELYRLQIGDTLNIKPLLNPELNDEVVIRPDGMISTIIAEDVQAYTRQSQCAWGIIQ
jgi:polysaccharide export outer membrane protein